MAKHSVRCPKRPATRCQTGTQNPLPIYPFLLFPTEVWLYAGAVGVSVVVVLLLGAVMHNKIRIYIYSGARLRLVFAFGFVLAADPYQTRKVTCPTTKDDYAHRSKLADRQTNPVPLLCRLTLMSFSSLYTDPQKASNCQAQVKLSVLCSQFHAINISCFD